MAYKLRQDGEILRAADDALIPADTDNVDYQTYLAWVADGNTPEPVPVPTAQEALEAERSRMVCSRFQARAALAAAGLLAAVEAAVSQADQFTQIAWSDAVEFRRNSPTILALASHPSIQLSETQLDDLFRAAMQIEA